MGQGDLYAGLSKTDRELFLAIEDDLPHSAQGAISRGANPNCKRADGRYPLAMAFRRGAGQCIDILLPLTDRGLLDEESNTPLIWAAICNRTDALVALAPGSDVLMKDRFGLTAFHWAGRRGNREAVLALLPHCPQGAVHEQMSQVREGVEIDNYDDEDLVSWVEGLVHAEEFADMDQNTPKASAKKAKPPGV